MSTATNFIPPDAGLKFLICVLAAVLILALYKC